jgi:glycosyltransferase involved in cell wall biosynthesis
MPKVLRIINRFNLGGPTFNAAYLTRYMEPDFETLLIGGSKDETEDSSEFIVNKLGIEPLIIPEMKREISFKNDKAAYNKIKQLIQEFKPDIVHTHASKAGAIGRLAASKLKVPVIVHTFHGHVFHSYFGKTKTNVYKRIERHLAKKSSCIIAISEKQKQELSVDHRICHPDKIRVVPLGFDLNRFRENYAEKRIQFRSDYGLTDDEIAIGIIGRLVPIKNHELFIKAIQAVQEKTTKKIRAFIVGDGEEMDNLQALATELNIPFSVGKSKSNNTITFTSWIKEVDVVTAGVDIVALTSKNEGTPVTLIEAQAANKPIVSTNVGGIENIVQSNKTALLSESGNVEAFAANLLQLVEDDSVRATVGQDGWEFVKEKFHYQRLVNDVSSLYLELLQQQR